MSITKSIHKRFWSKVNKKGPYPKPYTKVKTRCWIWTGCKDRLGYGHVVVPGDKIPKCAHRIAYELHYGKDSLGTLKALHRCDNRNCVRWSHLRKGSQLENIRDRDNKGRRGLLSKNSQLKLRKLYAKGMSLSAIELRTGIDILAIGVILKPNFLRKCLRNTILTS